MPSNSRNLSSLLGTDTKIATDDISGVAIGIGFYANEAALPTDGNLLGAKAYAESEGTLHFWNGASWGALAVTEYEVPAGGGWTVDISQASYDSVSFSVTSEESSPRNVSFNADGTKMYILGTASDTVHQYTLSTAFDLSTASYDSVSFSVASQETAPTAIAFNADGTKMYVNGTANGTVYQYSTGL